MGWSAAVPVRLRRSGASPGQNPAYRPAHRRYRADQLGAAVRARPCRCRFVACERRTCDLHHVRHYADGGPTAMANGILLCPRHHTLVHEGGVRITGEPDGTLTFHRTDGAILGISTRGGSTTPRSDDSVRNAAQRWRRARS